MAWIESHQALGGHRKLRELARELRISFPLAVGHLHYLWWWALDNAPDGDMSAIENADIADAAMWRRDPNSFVEALIKAGFIDNPGRLLHDWGDYAGKLIARRDDRRLQNREAQRRHRALLNVGQHIVSADHADSKRTTVPDPTVPDPTVLKKRSKENKATNNLPDWINKETWDAFLEMRVMKKKPPTAFAIKLIIRTLEKWRAAGHDVTAILNQSIVNTWTDVYAIKQEGKDGTYQGHTTPRALPTRYTKPEDL